MPPEPDISHAVLVLHQRGWGQRKIALEVGISRKLVRAILGRLEQQREQGHSVLPAAPRSRGSVLDLYQEEIARQLEDHPDITAVRLLEELHRVGYPGGYTIVKERLRQLRPEPKASPVERFETGPGEQGQQDWSPYVIHFTKEGPRKVRAFSFVLAFSRRQYVHFGEHEDLLTLERQHIAAFTRFGGLPREIFYDNQKVVVLRRELLRPIYNPKFLAFATHYGFQPRAMPPRTPKWKGKVEAPFQYIEGNLLNARTLATRAELDALCLAWMDSPSDTHVHDTTRERPIDRFAREKDALLPLPRHPYDTAEIAYRVVTEEGFVRWKDVPYSVPFSYLLDLVVLRVTEHEVFVYGSELSLIVCHEKAPPGHTQPVIATAHRPKKKPRHDIDVLVARLGELGEEAALFAAGLVRTQRFRGSHLIEVLRLVERYDSEDVVRAMGRAVRYRAFDAGVIVRILAATAATRPLPSTDDQRAQTRLQEQGAALSGPARSLAPYIQALEHEPDEPTES